MWAAVVIFALTAAQDPVRIGIVGLLVARPRPICNLFAYWLGLMTTGFGAALAALFLLSDFMPPIVRFLAAVAANPIIPPTKIAVGVLALAVAATLAAPTSVRQAALAPIRMGDPPGLAPQPKTPTVFSRLRGPLERGSPKIAFLAGLCTSTQIGEFGGAMIVILASEAAAGTKVSAALMFTLLAFAVAEIPLVSYLVLPGKTQATVMQLRDWVGAHRRPIFVFILSVVGLWMVINGLGKV
jgi:hypothetical protein